MRRPDPPHRRLEARDEQTIVVLFAPDVTWTADGGGKTSARLLPIVGADRIASWCWGLREKFWSDDRTVVFANINGEAGLCIRDGGRLTATISIATDGARILASTRWSIPAARRDRTAPLCAQRVA